jgi:hypothetical protein
LLGVRWHPQNPKQDREGHGELHSFADACPHCLLPLAGAKQFLGCHEIPGLVGAARAARGREDRLAERRTRKRIQKSPAALRFPPDQRP